MPPLVGRLVYGPPVLPPVPELSHDLLDGLVWEFDSFSITTPTLSSTTFTPSPPPQPPSPPTLHSPVPVKLMNANLILRPPPSDVADAPEDYSDVDDNSVEDDSGRAFGSALPEYLTPSPTRISFSLPYERDPSFKVTPPLNIRKKSSPANSCECIGSISPIVLTYSLARIRQPHSSPRDTLRLSTHAHARSTIDRAAPSLSRPHRQWRAYGRRPSPVGS